MNNSLGVGRRLVWFYAVCLLVYAVKINPLPHTTLGEMALCKQQKNKTAGCLGFMLFAIHQYFWHATSPCETR